MGKLFFKLFLFSTIMFFLINATDVVFKKNSLQEKSVLEYKKLNKVDIAIFGSSHASTNYDPRILENKLGLNTFNFGSPAQRYEITEIIAKKIVKEKNIKLAIIDIFKNNLLGINDSITAGLQFKTLDNMSFSLQKFSLLRDISKVKGVPFVYSTTIRNHTDWNEINRLSFSRKTYVFQGSEFYKGFRASNDCFNEKAWKKFLKKYKNKNNKDHTFKLNEAEKAKIDKVIDVFVKQDIPIIFVNAPSYVYDYDSNSRRYSTIIRQYIREKNIPFIDFNLLKDSLKITKEQFNDPNHLNTKGAFIVSNYLASFIDKNYNIPSESIIEGEEYNRYSHFRDNFKNAIYSKKLKDTLQFDYLTEVYIYKIDEDRYEIAIETTKDFIDDIRIKLNCKIKENEIKLIPSKLIKPKNGNIRYFDYLTNCSLHRFKEKNYIVFPFQYTLPKFTYIQFFIGEDLKYELFSIKNDSIY